MWLGHRPGRCGRRFVFSSLNAGRIDEWRGCVMAGRPKKRQMIADITKAGGLDGVIDRISSGETIGTIAEGFGVSRDYLSKWLNSHPAYADRLRKAKKARAEVWADEVKEIADVVEADPNEIAKAKLRMDARKWLAQVTDPETYGDRGAALTVNIGQLHLDALRRVGRGEVIDGEASDAGGDD